MDSNFNTRSKIIKVLDNLEVQIYKERSNIDNIPHSDQILSITKDTAIFLNIMLMSMNASRILEIGTSIGYSTLWFALAISQNEYGKSQPKSNKIITIENNPSKVKRATKNFVDAEIYKMIEIRQGDALDILYELSSSHDNHLYNKEKLFDFVFLDADKENLIKYFDLVLPMVRKGGLIVTDNILLPEEYRTIMSNYLQHIKESQSIRSVTVPIGHGEEISLKTI